MAKPKQVGQAISIEEFQRGTKRKHKFNAEHTWVDQIRFDSKREAERYRELVTLQISQNPPIRRLQLQRQFDFFTCGVKTDRWRIDFCYEERSQDDEGRILWTKVAEDVTGYLTTRKKRLIPLFEEQYGEEWKLRITS